MKNNKTYCFFLSIVLLFISGGASSCSDKKEEVRDGEFPIPYPTGGEVITDEWGGVAGHRTVKYEADRHGELLSFYDDYTSGSGWKRSESGSGSVPTTIYLNLDKGYTIDVGPPDDQVSDAVLVTLYVADYTDL